MKHTFKHYFRILSIGAAMLVASTVMINNAAAQIEPEERGRAVMAGIHIEVVADAWPGSWDFGDVQPLLVTIENKSETRLRIRYDQFAVVGPGGDRVATLPPFDIRETAVVDPWFTPGRYPYGVNGFWVAPYLSKYYPDLRPFDGPFVYDPWYYSTFYAAMRRVRLPTNDMLLRTLPEGVLEPGGRVTGFVYLEDRPESGDECTFVADLVSADNGELFGRVRVPIEVD
ncbi:MAG: hypothetical protein EHM55_16235 [Acidobacteria bacterium]|nr:MAG: hypothetical protein EHM55_16235 [Acidobacteriota bacterium]